MPFRAFKKHPLLMPATILMAGLVMFPAFTMYYTTSYVYRQDRQWCTLLGDITAQPAPKPVSYPGKSATEVQKNIYRAYIFYHDTRKLEHEYGCDR